jgi:hypothetical protein
MYICSEKNSDEIQQGHVFGPDILEIGDDPCTTLTYATSQISDPCLLEEELNDPFGFASNPSSTSQSNFLADEILNAKIVPAQDNTSIGKAITITCGNELYATIKRIERSPTSQSRGNGWEVQVTERSNGHSYPILSGYLFDSHRQEEPDADQNSDQPYSALSGVMMTLKGFGVDLTKGVAERLLKGNIQRQEAPIQFIYKD